VNGRRFAATVDAGEESKAVMRGEQVPSREGVFGPIPDRCGTPKRART